MEAQEARKTGVIENIPDYTGPGVYRIVNTDSQMTYVGSSVNVNRRLRQHNAKLAANHHHCKKLQADYNNGAVFTCEISAKVHVAFRPEIQQKEFQEVKRLESSGVRLYNALNLCPQYIPKNMVIEKLANLYCLEHFGMPLEQFLPDNKAEIQMKYEMLLWPEKASEIRDKYAKFIPHFNKKAFYQVQYGVDYDDYLEMTPEEQKAIKQRRREKMSRDGAANEKAEAPDESEAPA